MPGNLTEYNKGKDSTKPGFPLIEPMFASSRPSLSSLRILLGGEMMPIIKHPSAVIPLLLLSILAVPLKSFAQDAYVVADILDTTYHVTSLGNAGDALIYHIYIGSTNWILRSDGQAEQLDIEIDRDLYHPNSAFLFDFTELTRAGDSYFLPIYHEYCTGNDRDYYCDGMGWELWKIDTSLQHAELVRDIRSSSGSDPSDLIEFGGKLFFWAWTGEEDSGLWTSDGTESGTVLVWSHQGAHTRLMNFDRRLFFAARSGDGTTLWSTDGTSEGTRMVSALSVAPDDWYISAMDIEILDDTIIVLVRSRNGFDTRLHFWKSDGTENGTGLWFELPDSLANNERYLRAAGEKLYFAAYDPQNGKELWAIAANSNTPGLVRDLNPGAASSFPDTFAVVGETLVFAATDNSRGREIWRSDGTETGTYVLIDAFPGRFGSLPNQMTELHDRVFFLAKDCEFYSGNRLWQTDGTIEGTAIVKSSGPAYDVRYDHLTASDNGIFFTASNMAFGNELWYSDGSGARLLKDVDARCDQRTPARLSYANGKLYFSAIDGPYSAGREIWQSDATIEGTRMLHDIWPGSDNSDPELFTGFGEWVYFYARDANLDYSLFRTNGTDDGLELIKDIWPEETGYRPRPPALLYKGDGRLFFLADDGVHGLELWTTDGNTTQMVKDISEGGDNTYYGPVMLVGQTLTFAVAGPDGVWTLWKSDGTEEGTRRVRTFPDSRYGPNHLTSYRNKLYFVVEDEEHGSELWRSDGTRQGTMIVRDISPGEIDSSPEGLTVFDDKLFFVVTEGSHGVGLWFTDGTFENTTMMMPLIYRSRDLRVAGRKLFFENYSYEYGWELWYTDGTLENTAIFQDINDGAESSRPSDLTEANGYLFFSAIDGMVDYKLWAIPPNATSVEAFTPLPAEIALSQNYPNPFNAGTRISFALPEAGEVSLSIYNIRGQLVKLLHSGYTEAGEHNVRWDGLNTEGVSAASGIYIYRLDVGDHSLSNKLVLIR